MLDKQTCFILRVPPPYGGGEIVSNLLYEGLKNEYDFFLIKRKGHSKSKQQNSSISKFFYGLSYILKIVHYIIKQKPHKVYIGLPKTFGAFLRNAFIIYYCNYKGIIVLAELHGMNFLFQENFIFKFILRSTLNRISKIRVLSTCIKNNLINIGYSNRIEIVDNAVKKPVVFKSKSESKELQILYLGLISERKGFSRLMKIIKTLKEKNISNIKFNVIGEWHSVVYKVSCLKQIKIDQTMDYFVFHGPLYNDDKWETIAKNDMIVHLTEFDGQPLTLIECMSLGIPCISTKIGAIPEMIINNLNGFLIDEDSELIKIIERVLPNINCLESYKINCLQTYNDRFTPEILYSKIRNFIDN